MLIVDDKALCIKHNVCIQSSSVFINLFPSHGPGGAPDWAHELSITLVCLQALPLPLPYTAMPSAQCSAHKQDVTRREVERQGDRWRGVRERERDERKRERERLRGKEKERERGRGGS